MPRPSFASQRWHQRGIALGPILFILAIMATLAAVMSLGSGGMGSAALSDRIEQSLTNQANLIRAKVTECWILSQGTGTPAFPVTAGGQDAAVSNVPALQTTTQASIGTASCLGTGSHPAASSNACFNAAALVCPYSGTLIFGGTSGTILPPQPDYMGKWVYARDGNAIRISIAPMSASPAAEVSAAIKQARSRFSGPTTANGTVQSHHETDADETTWVFTVWVRR